MKVAPYYCPCCDIHLMEKHTTEVTNEEYKKNHKESKRKFLNILETDILLCNPEIFGDDEEHCYNVNCYDGYAIASLSDHSDEKAPSKLKLEYPLLDSIDNETKKLALEYRGLHDVKPESINFGDLMLFMGSIVPPAIK